MYRHRGIGSVASGLLPWMLGFCLLTANARAQSNDIIQIAPTTQSLTNADDESAKAIAAQMQILAELQMQQQAALKELQQAREEIAASLADISSNNVAQLAAVSEMIVVQRKQDLKAVRDSQRIGLAIVVGMSGLLVLSILILNMTSLRALNRMTTMLSGSVALSEAEARALADIRASQKKQLLLFPGEQKSPPQLDNALLQLQQRIQSLEHLAGKERSVAQSPDSISSGNTSAKAGEIPATSPAR